MLLGNWEASMRKCIVYQPVRVEIHLPIVLVVAVWANCEHRARKVERQDLDVRRRLSITFGTCSSAGFSSAIAACGSTPCANCAVSSTRR